MEKIVETVESTIDTHAGLLPVQEASQVGKETSELKDTTKFHTTEVESKALDFNDIIGVNETWENLDEMVLVGETVESRSETVGIELKVTEASSDDEVESPETQSLIHPSPASKPGTVYIEGRLRDDSPKMASTQACKNLQYDLYKCLTSPDQHQYFDLGEDLLADELKAMGMLRDLYEKVKSTLQFLKVVEYLGQDDNLMTHSFSDVKVNIQIYTAHRSRRAFDDEDFTQGEITSMPHVMFDGKWDDLVFDTDVKGELIWLMTNMVRFSQGCSPESRDVNPLILLYGPPGTGKTTLCQGLAQKISIRLKHSYDETLLVSIKTVTLLSKWFSESAKQVDEIFTSLEGMCEDDPKRFICVLIDEVESIAGCREASTDRGEAHDALRATNALITGLDRSKRYPNIIILCTSNMIDCLDAAFLDRCGLLLPVGPPTEASQYAILHGRIRRLITRGVVTSNITLPPYRDAEIDFTTNPELSTNKLYRIVKLISSRKISARSLIQLPEQAIMRYLRDEDCNLDMALGFIERLVLAQHSQNRDKKRKRESGDGNRE